MTRKRNVKLRTGFRRRRGFGAQGSGQARLRHGYGGQGGNTQKSRDEVFSFPLANIKVVGIGGGGGNAVSRMNRDFTRGVEFIAINTDHQDLDHCDVRRKIYIGKNLTKGLGTGMNPELGRQAAEENRSEIAEAIQGANLVFVTAGLGGGTGTGAIPVVAEVAKQNGALTLAFVTKPFAFEGTQRSRIAEEGLVRLRDKVDSLVIVPNDRIFSLVSKETPILKAFEAIDDVLKNALRGIVEIIVTPGIVNLDFADVRTVVADAGATVVGMGIASGEDRAQKAVHQALHSPLLELSPEGAKGVLLGIAGRDVRMAEVNEVAKAVSQIVDPGARIIFGSYHDRRLRPTQLKVMVIATGLNGVQAAPLFATHYDARPSFLEEREVLPRARGEEGKTLELEVEEFAGKPQEETKGSKKKESEIWDIPTFLRKRRR